MMFRTEQIRSALPSAGSARVSLIESLVPAGFGEEVQKFFARLGCKTFSSNTNRK